MAASWVTKGLTIALTNGSFEGEEDGGEEEEEDVLGDPPVEVLGEDRGEPGDDSRDGETSEGCLGGLPGATREAVAASTDGKLVVVLSLVVLLVLLLLLLVAVLAALASTGEELWVVSCGDEEVLLLLWAMSAEREGWSTDRRICMSSASFLIINSCWANSQSGGGRVGGDDGADTDAGATTIDSLLAVPAICTEPLVAVPGFCPAGVGLSTSSSQVTELRRRATDDEEEDEEDVTTPPVLAKPFRPATTLLPP